ncbi:MAG: quinol:cytochrome C oxidoreductase [Bacteroidia bacterium]|nr:MAG: quinol:cytochrome C oxidoreductase [Bacteroidia bacterium]
MEHTYKPSTLIKALSGVLILIGVLAVIYGFTSDPARTWSNMLINNMYFITLAIGALLFYSMQYITDSAWSALFQRVPLAIGAFLPIGAVLMLLLYFGLPDIYEWALPGITETDKLIAHKEPFLNLPFFMTRMVVYFTMWIALFVVLRKIASKEDSSGGMDPFIKSRYYSKVFIFVAAISFSLAAKDWIMTIDSHWYSTLFGFRAAVTSIYYAVAVIILIILYLNKLGYFPQLNTAHRNDLARYLFRFSIVFGYLWFMQFLIIWYANIPELTAYYYPRFLGEWQVLFYAELLINFAIPFIVMMSDVVGRNKIVMPTISIILLIGLWVSLFLQVMPGSTGELQFGFIETGMWLGYAGLFIFAVFTALSGLNLLPKNHPQLEESIHHHI